MVHQTRLLLKNLLISSQLLLSSLLFPALSFADSSPRSSAPSSREECDRNQFYRWDAGLNRCLQVDDEFNDLELVEMRRRHKICQAMDDADDRRACIIELAQEIAQGNETNRHANTVSQVAGYANSAFAVGAALLALIGPNRASQTTGLCPSRTTLGVVSAAGFAGHIAIELFTRRSLNQLEDEFKKFKEQGAGELGSQQEQIKALEFIRDREDIIVKLTTQRATLFGIITAGYAASLAMGIAELVSPLSSFASGCYNTETLGDIENVSLAEDRVSDAGDQLAASEGRLNDINNSLFMHAARSGAVAITSGGFDQGFDSNEVFSDAADAHIDVMNANNELREAQANLTEAQQNAPGQVTTTATALSITFSSIGLAVNGTLMAANLVNRRQARNNRQAMSLLIDAFSESMRGVCQSRTDSSDPSCYCYTSNGQRNSNRSNSDICQREWERNDRNMHFAADDYSQGVVTEKGMGCVDMTDQYDGECKCARIKDSRGENFCKKAPALVNFELPQGLGDALGVRDIARSVESIYDGGLTAGRLEHGSLQQSAMRAARVREQLQERLNQERRKNNRPPLDLSPEAAYRNLTRSPSYQALNNQLSQSSFELSAQTSEQAAEDQQNVAGQELGMSGGSGIDQRRRQDSAADDDFAFNFGQQASRSAATKSDSAPPAQFNYTNDDVVTREDVSIWNVLSRRYNTTGLRRLFPDGEGP